MKYVISSYSEGNDKPLAFKTLILRLFRVESMGGEELISLEEELFIYKLDSPVAQHIISQPITNPLEIDLSSFTEGDIVLDGSEFIAQYHEDYVIAEIRFDNKALDYDQFKELGLTYHGLIPDVFYEHLYSFFKEGASQEEYNRYTSIAHAKSRVDEEMLESTIEIIKNIEGMMKHNCDIEVLRNIVEYGFYRKEFGKVKSHTYDNGNVLTYYETNMGSYNLSERHILLFGILKKLSPDMNTVMINTTESFWQIFLFIVACQATRFRYYVGDKYLEVRISNINIDFHVIDMQTYRITIYLI